MVTALNDHNLIEESEALLLLAEKSSDEVRRAIHDQVIEMNLGLARSLAARYAGKGPDFDDLLQVASLGLVKAVQRYEGGKGHFASYAVPTILGELKRYFRDRAWMVRPPRRLQELQAEISSVTAELSQTGQGTVGPDALAEHLDADPRDIREAMTASGCFAPASLDASTTAGHLSSAQVVAIEEDGYECVERMATVAEHCRRLSASDRELLALRFFDDKTQQEIADEVGMSQMQVSRHLKRILATLRDSVSADAA